MDIIGEAASGEVYVIARTGGQEASEVISDLRREIESGRTRWFAVVGAGVEAPDLEAARERAGVHLDRGELCNCEHTDHWIEAGPREGEHHRYRQVFAQGRHARYVGEICDPCADGHMANYLL